MRKLNNVMGLCIALMMSSMAFAKGQVKSTVISSDYSRNSISKITILYGDRWDNQVVTGVDSIQTGAKFDINNIKTKTIRLKGAFRTAEEQQAQLAAQQPQEKTNAFKDMFKGIGDSFKGLRKGAGNDLLYLHGRTHGLRYRSLSCLRVQVHREGCPFQCEEQKNL